MDLFFFFFAKKDYCDIIIVRQCQSVIYMAFLQYVNKSFFGVLENNLFVHLCIHIHSIDV